MTQLPPPFSPSPEETDPPLRPLEKTLRFLEAEVNAGGATPKRLPTIREVASRLKVSPRTVQKAFHLFSREGQIESVTGRGTFTVPRPNQVPGGPQLQIGLNIDFDHYDPVNTWANTIYGAILQASLASGRNAVFTSVESALGQRQAPMDGFILLPDAMEISERLRREQPATPAVFLNPPVIGATANFVSPDYNRLGLHLGRTWSKCARKRILFMHHPALAISASGQLLLSGLISGLAKTYNDLEYLHLLEAGNFTPEAGYDTMREFLRQGRPRPDAIFCKGDFLALGAIKALEEEGCRVPAEVSVIGGSGLDLSEAEWPQLTRCRQPFQQLGDALFEMLLLRIEQGGAPQPGRFLPAPFIGGATTTEAENNLLFQPENFSAPSTTTSAIGA